MPGAAYSPSNAAADAEALAKLKWEQKKEQLYLGVVLVAATVAAFIEAGKNNGLPSTLKRLNNDMSSDDLYATTMSCTDPRPDPLTNSTAHFGDCCGVYGVT